MLILIGLFVMALLGIIFMFSWNELLGFVLLTFGGFFFVVTLIFIPIERLDCHSQISQFKNVQETIQTARGGDRDIERAAIQRKIVEKNEWLTRKQFYNDTVFDIFIPDEVDELEPIK